MRVVGPGILHFCTSGNTVSTGRAWRSVVEPREHEVCTALQMNSRQRKSSESRRQASSEVVGDDDVGMG